MRKLISAALLSLFAYACSPAETSSNVGNSTSEDPVCNSNQRHCEGKKE